MDRTELIELMQAARAVGDGYNLSPTELDLLFIKPAADEEIPGEPAPPPAPPAAKLDRCDVQIRWLIRRDMPDVLEIEKVSFQYPWSEEDFLVQLRQRNCIGMVAEAAGQKIVGYAVYELDKTTLRLLNLAVHPEYRRRQIGQQFMWKFMDKLASQRRSTIETIIRETNLTAQKFFSSCGFKCSNVVRGHYEDTAEDAYLMVYTNQQMKNAN